MGFKLQELKKRLMQQAESGTEEALTTASFDGGTAKELSASASTEKSASARPSSPADLESVAIAESLAAEPAADSVQPAAIGPTLDSEDAVIKIADDSGRTVLSYAHLARARAAAAAAAAKAAEADDTDSTAIAPIHDAPIQNAEVNHAASVNNDGRANNGKSPTNGIAVTASSGNGATPTNREQHDLAQAVAQMFVQTKVFRDQFDELTRTFKTIERMGDLATKAFAPLQSFRDQIAQVALTFEPMRAFQAQLAQMAQTFEPMKMLEQQVSQLTDAFQVQLEQIVSALEPARQFRDRVMGLARSFEPVADLQEEFSELHNAFAHAPKETTARMDPAGADPVGKMTDIVH